MTNDPRVYIPFLKDLIGQDLSFQILEVFINVDGKKLERVCVLFRIPNHLSGLESEGIEYPKLLKESLSDSNVYLLPSILNGPNKIICSYNISENSISGSNSNRSEIKIISDFESTSTSEYSHIHKASYENEYREILIDEKLKNMVTVPLFIKSQFGILRGMNFADWSNSSPTLFNSIEDSSANDLIQIARAISAEVTYTKNSVNIVRVPRIPFNTREEEVFKKLKQYWIGKGDSFEAILKEASKFCFNSEPLLIHGETGTGKTYLAKLIAKNSVWFKDQFRGNDKIPKSYKFENSEFTDSIDLKEESEHLLLNTASLPNELFESELFGIAPKTATNVEGKLGALVATNGKYKTVVLDEIAEINKQNQTKLLLAIDEKRIKAVGSNKLLDISGTRIVACTNQDIFDEQIFRKDLRMRFPNILYIPPLRERKKDIEAQMDEFIKKREKQKRNGRIDTSEEFRAAIRAYDFPGNSRELNNVLKSSTDHLINDKGTKLMLEHLPQPIRDAYYNSELEGVIFRTQLDDKIESKLSPTTYRPLSDILSNDEHKIALIAYGIAHHLNDEKLSYQGLEDFLEKRVTMEMIRSAINGKSKQDKLLVYTKRPKVIKWLNAMGVERHQIDRAVEKVREHRSQ